MKKKKPNWARHLKLKVLHYWACLVKHNAGYQCEVCGKTEGLNAHHIISRNHLHLKHDVRNGCCLCVSCHMFGQNAAHKNPVWFMDWLDATRPDDLNYLRKEQNKLEPNFDYKECFEKLKEQIEINNIQL